MAIINSCCFWKSLKKGSIASAVYSLCYFVISTISFSIHLYNERYFLMGLEEKPTNHSFIGSTPFNVIMSLPLLGCSVAGIIATVLAIIGLRKDQREFLVPFVFIMLIDVTIATIHFVKLVLFGGLPFDPMTGLIFTIDFFAICLNTYCLVCILSQYQEYKSGYVNSSNEYIMDETIVSYIAQPPPEKSCIVLHQSKNGSTVNINNNSVRVANLALIQESQKTGSATNNGLRSPFQRRKPKSTLLLKKQVKFTDEFKCTFNGNDKIVEEESNFKFSVDNNGNEAEN